MRYDLVDQHYPTEPDPAFRRRAAWVLAQVEAQIGAKIGARFPDGLDLLDVGCGQGFYFPLYSALRARVTAAETDPVPLTQAMTRARTLGARVVQAKAEDLPFDAAQFDVVVLSEVLEHLPIPALALAEAARVLRPGGLLLVTVPHADYPALWDPLNRGLQRLRLPPIRRGMFAGIWANHERLYQPESLRAEVTAAGFRVDALVFQTRACLPFLHNLVYGVGRAALERGMLPKRWLPKGLRGTADAPQMPERGSGAGPVAWMVRLIRWIDRANPDFTVLPGPSVNLCLAATRLSGGSVLL